MNQLNPYEKFLDGRPVMDVLAETPRAIALLFEEMGAGKAYEAPAPGKWSAGEIVAHLADCELVFGFRLRQTQAEDSPTIQPFDQDKWAKPYRGIEPKEALAGFTALRRWNLLFLEAALPAAAERTMTHPERGTMTFQAVVETMAGHDLNHLGQLRWIADSAQ